MTPNLPSRRGWGSHGPPRAKSQDLAGVRVFDPAGKAIGHIRWPQRCANACFGGPPKKRRPWPAAIRSKRPA